MDAARGRAILGQGTKKTFPEDVMKKLMLVAALGLVATQAAAQDKLKVGILTTLSGPPAALGAAKAA